MYVEILYMGVSCFVTEGPFKAVDVYVSMFARYYGLWGWDDAERLLCILQIYVNLHMQVLGGAGAW